MAQNLNLYLNVGNLLSVGQSALNSDDASAKYTPGAISIQVDAFGLRVFRYGRTQQSGGMSKGELSARLGDVTGTVTAAVGEVNDTLHLSDTTNFTADNEIGKVCHITDNNDSAGAAPEGEVAVVVANTASIQTFDPNYPLSTAVAVSDTYRNYSVYHHDDSADGDLAINILGIVMADRSAAYYGWLQMYGLNPGALLTTSAVTAGNPLVADAAALGPHGCDTEQLWCGWSPGTIAADLASPFRSLVFIDVLHAAQPIA